MIHRSIVLLALASTPVLAGSAGVKSVFLNGVDISSARNQELKNVDVLVNDQGDIFLLAPHYQVNEEDTYVPLSQYAQGLGNIAHKPPQTLRGGAQDDQAKGQENPTKAKSKPETPAAEDAPRADAPAPSSASTPTPKDLGAADATLAPSAKDLPTDTPGDAERTGRDDTVDGVKEDANEKTPREAGESRK